MKEPIDIIEKRVDNNSEKISEIFKEMDKINRLNFFCFMWKTREGGEFNKLAREVSSLIKENETLIDVVLEIYS